MPILTYHNVDYSGSSYPVTPERLADRRRWLFENGSIAITLGELWNGAMGLAKSRPTPIVLTNDDGWESAMSFAEIVAQHGMPTTFSINIVLPPSPDQIDHLKQCGAVRAAQAAGIVAAFGLGGTPAYVGAIDPYHIPRILITVEDDLAMFAAKVNGW